MSGTGTAYALARPLTRTDGSKSGWLISTHQNSTSRTAVALANS